jgi:hypothetical protein
MGAQSRAGRPAIFDSRPIASGSDSHHGAVPCRTDPAAFHDASFLVEPQTG